jgi:hypothetical protein
MISCTQCDKPLKSDKFDTCFDCSQAVRAALLIYNCATCKKGMKTNTFASCYACNMAKLKGKCSKCKKPCKADFKTCFKCTEAQIKKDHDNKEIKS